MTLIQEINHLKAEQHELKQKWLEESIKAKESGINMDRTRAV